MEEETREKTAEFFVEFSKIEEKIKSKKTRMPCFNLVFFNWDSFQARLKVSTRHEVTRKRSTKRLKHIENLFRTNLPKKGIC